MSRRLNMPPVKPERTPGVSDHALVRWLERRHHIDLDVVRATILTPERQEAIRCGATSIHCREEGLTLIVAENGTIKTVLTGIQRGRS